MPPPSPAGASSTAPSSPPLTSSRLPASSPPTSPTSPPWRPRLNSVRGDFNGGGDERGDDESEGGGGGSCGGGGGGNGGGDGDGGGGGDGDGGGGGDGDSGIDAVELLLQASVGVHDWVMLGAQHQRLTLLHPPTGGGIGEGGIGGVGGEGGEVGAGGSAEEVVLRWRLLPLREGYLPLPLLAAWSVLQGGVDGASAVVGEPLPPPAVIGGVSVHVLPIDA